MSKIGRNELCPCGSGKKYKKCCFLKVVPAVRTEESLFVKLIQALYDFLHKHYYDLIPEAEEEFWGDFDPEENLDGDELWLSNTNFTSWSLIDYSVDDIDYEPLIDSYIKKNKKIADDEFKLLQKLRDSFVSLYEVKEVRLDEWTLLKDLLSGKEFFMNGNDPTHYLEKGEVFAARLLRLDGKLLMAAEAYPYEKTLKKAIINTIMVDYECFQDDEPNATLKDFLKQNSDIFNYIWYSSLFEPPEINTANIVKPVAKVTNMKSEKVPNKIQPVFDAIVKLTDAFCKERLNEEYAELARYATAALCRKRPSPLLTGQLNSWACGIVYALGYVNFLFDRGQEPHMNASELCAGFSVAKSTGSAKSKVVRDALKLAPFHPDWCLESLMDKNPYTWLIKINGFVVDARSLTREEQEILFKNGLIPYIPEEREKMT